LDAKRQARAVAARLRAQASILRTRPLPIGTIIPLLQEAADALDGATLPPPAPQQWTFDFDATPAFLDRALAIVGRYPDQFRDGFGAWLIDNHKLQHAFESGALRVAQRRAHYGANSIVETMRFHTALADSGGAFKINDKWVSSMAHLFAHMNRAHAGLLEFRHRADSVIAPLRFED
jgi:hypothetical protein